MLYLEFSMHERHVETAPPPQSPQGGAMSVGGEYTKEQYRLLEDKLYAIQEELTNTLREKTQRTESLLQARQNLRDLENDNRTLKDEVASLKQQLQDQVTSNDVLQKDLKTADSTIELLKKQRSTLEEELGAQKKHVLSLKEENQSLLNAFLEQKQKQIDEMNQINDLHKNLELQKKEVAYLRARYNVGKSEDDSDSSRVLVVHPPTKKHKQLKFDTEVNTIAFSPDNQYLAIGLFDKTVRLYDTNTYQESKILANCTESLLRVNFSHDAQYCLGSFGESVNIWSTQTGRSLHTLTGHTKKIYAADFSSDSTRVVTGSHDRSMKIWDTSRGALIKTIVTSCRSTVNDLELSKPSNLIVSAHFDNSIRIHDLKSCKLVTELPKNHTQQVTSVNISRDGKYVLSMGRDHSLRVWDLRNFKQVYVFTNSAFKNQLNWNKAVFSPRGEYIAAGSSNGQLFVWDILGGGLYQHPSIPLKAHKDQISGVSWRDDGSEIASCGRDKLVTVFQ
eukprot:CAMPEP_0117440858 /NCGR_PEP_ID=MMETSP0759-20121206/3314_1 /TAXON_ID=63605 /ORGANISM="Percolomonas cosmopolitus, Strain WS" /LENGTH=504 /DNA_ID=CAMNT_0005232651 /DNA_START=157 /DNA_END=1671 /DNA_ORIENTATION=+